MCISQVIKPMQIVCLLLLLTCCKNDPAPNVYRFESTMNSGNRTRYYVVNLPHTYYNEDSLEYPLVLALHGTGGSAVQMEGTYGLNEKADASGFIVAYPEGVRSNGIAGIRTWNAGTCCDFAMEQNVDDVSFIKDVMDQLSRDYRINKKRIYITGMSNGAMMTYRLACELSDRIAAAAPVSGTLLMKYPCTPSRKVPIIHMHSKLDTKVPLAGGTGLAGYYFPPVDSTLQVWRALDNCTSEPSTVDNGKVVHTTWSCSEGTKIESYFTYDGGHSWPGGAQVGLWGDPPSVAINADDLMWSFFQQFELP